MIKTWQERRPDGAGPMEWTVDAMRMQEEIDELRAKLEAQTELAAMYNKERLRLVEKLEALECYDA